VPAGVSGVADETPAICEKAGARVLQRRLEGFADQKQFALDQTQGDWALSIDADERVTPALADEIRRALAQPQADGYRLRREMYFLGARLRHGGVGEDRVLRLLRRGKGRYRPVRVHESIEVDGVVGDLASPLLHYSYASIEEYCEKANHYTTLAAADLFGRGRRFRVTDHLRPSWELLQRIVFKGAWLDGRPGIVYAALSAHTAWLRAVKLWQLEHRKLGRWT